MKIEESWLLERVQSIYPEFKNGVDKIISVQVGAQSITIRTLSGEKILKFEYDLYKDISSEFGYHIVYESKTLYIQKWL